MHDFCGLALWPLPTIFIINKKYTMCVKFSTKSCIFANKNARFVASLRDVQSASRQFVHRFNKLAIREQREEKNFVEKGQFFVVDMKCTCYGETLGITCPCLRSFPAGLKTVLMHLATTVRYPKLAPFPCAATF